MSYPILLTNKELYKTLPQKIREEKPIEFWDEKLRNSSDDDFAEVLEEMCSGNLQATLLEFSMCAYMMVESGQETTMHKHPEMKKQLTKVFERELM